jgi:disulfide bond formation protein DsbB
MNFATFLSGMLSWLTVGGQILCLVMLGMIMFSSGRNKLMDFIRKHGVKLAFVVTAIAVLGSLSYSDILGYEPCKLCWYQRIFMYPQLIILGIALYAKDRRAPFYATVLSLIGIPIAMIHYFVQRGMLDVGCSTVGYSVSCAKVFTMNLGYITIPLMAFTAFLMNALFLYVSRNKEGSVKA